MTDDLQVSNSIASFIRFIKRNKNTLLLFVLIGVVSTIFFQKLKKPYYTTEAICSSGISEYERMEQVQEMSQRTNPTISKIHGLLACRKIACLELSECRLPLAQ